MSKTKPPQKQCLLQDAIHLPGLARDYEPITAPGAPSQIRDLGWNMAELEH